MANRMITTAVAAFILSSTVQFASAAPIDDSGAVHDSTTQGLDSLGAAAVQTMPVSATSPDVSSALTVPPSSSSRQQGAYLKTWSGGWTYQGIMDMFTPLYGKTDLIFVTFFQPTPNGLDCPSQSPCTTIWSSHAQDNVPASVVYKEAITAAATTGIRTVLSIGGWSYKDDFGFLSTMDNAALSAWAQSVKNTVDEFGAHGIDIDYEGQTAAQWENELVKTNVIGHLRAVMPASQYSISLTIGGIAAAYGTPQEVQAAFNPPLAGVYPLAGVALPTIMQSLKDIDRIQLMTYDGEPNMDPRVCMTLSSAALQAMGAGAQANAKLFVGSELGEQFGDCNGVTAGWCNQDLPAVTSMATDVVDHSYGGMFYWSNLDTPASATYYDTTYAIVKQ